MIEFRHLSNYERDVINQLLKNQGVTPENLHSLFVISKEEITDIITDQKGYYFKRITTFLTDNDFAKIHTHIGPSYEITDEGKILLKYGTLEKYFNKGKSPQDLINEKTKKRTDLLIAFFHKVNGNTDIPYDMRDLAVETDLDDNDFKTNYHLLKDKGFIEFAGTGHRAKLTPQGLEYAESIISPPPAVHIPVIEKTTHHNTTVNVGGNIAGVTNLGSGNQDLKDVDLNAAEMTATTAKQTSNPPIDKEIGWSKKLANWFMKNIWALILGISSGVITFYILKYLPK